MKKLLNVYKPKGLTPLQTIDLIRKKFPEYKNAKIGYAGRLDPLAHGVLLLMIGEATKEKDKYLNLPKEYEFEAVFGISTDTYDALGLLQSKPVIANEGTHRLVHPEAKQSHHKEIASSSSTPRNDKEIELKINIQNFIKSKLGRQTQIYPTFSSKTVEGKPLFWWARENRLSEIKIPQREIEIYDFKILEIKEISVDKLKEEIMKQISLVQGDFRQKEIKEKWEEFFERYSLPVIPVKTGIQKKLDSRVRGNDKLINFKTARFKISCSSGTYVRSIVNELGEKLGAGAIAFEILRTKVGEYQVKESIILQK